MLRSLRSLAGTDVHAADGEIGRIESFHFDDHSWTVRYLVLDSGSFLRHEYLLVPPAAIAHVGLEGQHLQLAPTRKEIESGPAYEAHKPVSRQLETEVHLYYRLGFYWTHLGDPNLRNSKDLFATPVEASDGEVGEVGDFIADLDDWTLRDVVVDLGGAFRHKEVLAPVQTVARLGWDEPGVHLDLTAAQVDELKAYDSTDEVNQIADGAGDFHYYDYWGRPKH